MALPAAAQTLPLPKKNTEPAVICTGCAGKNAHLQNNDGLKLTPFASPIAKHVGRVVDSSSTESYQHGGNGFRTARAGKILTAPTQRGNAPPRAYMRIGEAIFAWNLNTFFTSALPGGMSSVKQFDTGSNYGSKARETILLPHAYVYPEAKYDEWDGSTVGDDQNTFGDMDYDDRGYVYAAMTTFGWGIVKDSGETGAAPFALVSPQIYPSINPENIFAFKAGSKYYALVGDSSADQVLIYDATSAANPTSTLRKGSQWGFKVAAKNAAATRFAYVGGDGKLRVYDGSAYVSAGAPLIELSPTPGDKRQIMDVAFDANGNIWIAEARDGTPVNNVLRRLSPSGSGYIESAPYDVYGEKFSAYRVHASDGYLVVSGWGTGYDGSPSLDVKVFKIEGNNLRPLEFDKYFSKHYHRAPSGFAQPQVAPGNYSSNVFGADTHIIKWNGKVYLMYNTWGVGDVYELDSGGSINASAKANSYGTANPHSKGTPGPYPGDIVTFNGTTSVQGSTGLLWDFGNPEAGTGANVRDSNSGQDIQHQYTGLNTSALITQAKTVTVSDASDQTVIETLTLSLKVPTPRIGLPDGTAVSASTTGVNVAVGETLKDASDGSVESHIANWTVDSVATKAIPSATIGTGVVGPHTVTLSGSYGKYNAATLVSSGTPYQTGSVSVSYTARPFLFTFKPATKSGSSVTFGATGRKTSDTVLMPATQWTYTWTLKNNNTDVVPPQTATVAIGTIPNYVVSTAIPSGSILTLKLNVDPAQLATAAAAYAEYSESMTLEAPDPKITKSGCGNALASCTFTASSIGNKSMSDWTLTWKLMSGNTEVATGTGTTFSPNISAAGTYKVKLTATKAIFENPVEQDFTVAGALCGPPVDSINVGIHVGCATCSKNTDITIRADLYDYTPQSCDQWVWNFGDGTSSVTLTGTTGWLTKHKYASDGTYKIRLTVKNSAGETVVAPKDITIGNDDTPPPPPPPSCDLATSVSFTYSGSQGCRANIDCKVGESITFTPRKNGKSIQDCDTAMWTWHDGSGISNDSPSKTYNSEGSYVVKLKIRNSKGTSSEVSQTIKVVPDSTTCTVKPTEDHFYIVFLGRESGCSNSNTKVCKPNEIIDFRATEQFGYKFQGCDKFEWTFGDNSSKSTSQNTTHTYSGTAGNYEVSLRVYNTVGGTTIKEQVRFTEAPVQPAPVLKADAFPTNGTKGVAITFTATSDLASTTGWTWNFGDGTGNNTSNASAVGLSNSISHVFATAGQYSVTVRARNGNDTSTQLTALASGTITIVDVPTHRFLLPAVIHQGGQNGSVWRSDVQVYYPAPNPATEPLQMTASYNGKDTPLTINRSTFIYEDFARSLSTADSQGPVIITTQSKYKPQIWTRTYNVDPSGKTFGQFIPAVDLSDSTSSVIEGSADPVKYYLPGLRQNSRYRTNLGFINPNSTQTLANVVAYDDLRIPLHQFTVDMAPFQLVPINGLQNVIPNLPDRPITLEITVAAGKWLVAYASFIDGISNDPAYIPAVPDADLAHASYATGSITPGVGHIGDWRSDVTIYNPDVNGVKLNLTYYDSVGLPRGEAKDVFLGAGQSKTYEDLLKVAGLWTAAPPDGLGMLVVTPTTQVTRYPMTFARTYNEKGTSGTFGQGIPGFGAGAANVKLGQGAIIPGVRSDANYKTNIGLTNTTALPVNVIVRLLDPATGAVAKKADGSNNELAVSLSAHQSVVATFNFEGLQTGTFKIEITAGQGQVWAFASIINQNTDPEYVPALPLQ